MSPANCLLAALSPDACLTVAALAEMTGLDNRVIVKSAGALVYRNFATRAEIGCFTLTGEGLAFRQAGKEITSGPIGGLSQTYRRAKKTTLGDRLWAALRIRSKATMPELLVLAGDGVHDYKSAAGRYLAALEKVEYLYSMNRRAPGTALTSPGFKRYSLIKNTGPEAPQLRVRTGEIYDPNTGEIHKLGASS